MSRGRRGVLIAALAASCLAVYPTCARSWIICVPSASEGADTLRYGSEPISSATPQPFVSGDSVFVRQWPDERWWDKKWFAVVVSILAVLLSGWLSESMPFLVEK
jgi:hypothetical protein